MRRLCIIWVTFSVLAAGCGRLAFDDDIAVVEAELRFHYSTPNSIRWQWADPETLGVSPQSQELIIAPESEGLAGPNATIVAGAVNPELGFLDDDTITDGLLPDTAYVAQLRLLGAGGELLARSAETPVGSTTAEPTDELVIFADDATAGYSIPSELIHTEGGGHAGTHCYSFVSSCDPDEPACFENLRRQGIDHDLTVIPDEAWPTAFVEFAVAADGGLHSEYSQVRVIMKNRSNDETRVFIFGSFTVRADGAYRVYQVPLEIMAHEDVGLSPADALTDSLFEFGVGGSWTAGATVRLDEVRIRY